MQVSLPQPKYADETKRRHSSIVWSPVFGRSPAWRARRLVRRCRSRAPATRGRSRSKGVRRSGRDSRSLFRVGTSRVSGDTWRVPAEGRLIDERDVAGAPRAAVVNQTMARQFLPNQSAAWTPDPIRYRRTVVHHCRRRHDVLERGYEQDDKPAVYVSSPQVAASPANLVVRVSGDPLSSAAAVQRVIQECRSGSAGSTD